MLATVKIRPATEADQVAITAMIRAARISPRALYWPQFLSMEKSSAERSAVIETTNLEPSPGGSKRFGAILRDQERLGQMLGVIVFGDDPSVGDAHALVESRRRRG